MQMDLSFVEPDFHFAQIEVYVKVKTSELSGKVNMERVFRNSLVSFQRLIHRPLGDCVLLVTFLVVVG